MVISYNSLSNITIGLEPDTRKREMGESTSLLPIESFLLEGEMFYKMFFDHFGFFFANSLLMRESHLYTNIEKSSFTRQ